MNEPLRKLLPGVGALVLTAGVLLAVTFSRPEDSGADLVAPALQPTPTVPPARTPTATRVPPAATSTRPPSPTALPATPPPATGGESLPALTGLRFVNVTVLENPGDLPVDFPPGMPLESVVGVSRSEVPNLVTFFITPPFPFIPMTGSTPLGPTFGEEGGSGVATGSGRFLDGSRATFSLDFRLFEGQPFRGTLTIADAGTGATILVLSWNE